MKLTQAMIDAFKTEDDHELRRLLHLFPGDISPLEITGPDDECVYPAGTAGAKSWPKAVALRKALEQAASE